MKNTEAFHIWSDKIESLIELLEDCVCAMDRYCDGVDPKERQINYITVENMNKNFKEAKEAIEFIKGRIYGYFPVNGAK